MITKNFYNFVSGMGMQKDFYVKIPRGDEKLIAYSTASKTSFGGPFNVMCQCSKGSSSSVGQCYMGVVFGSGSTQPTIDDYCLENEIIDSLTVSCPSSTSCNETEDYVEYTATFGVTPRAEAVTISEAGVFAGSTTYGTYLVDRIVFDEPIVINPGETKQLTYTIRMNYPTA